MKKNTWLKYFIGIAIVALAAFIIVMFVSKVINNVSDTSAQLDKKVNDELKYLEVSIETLINDFETLNLNTEIQALYTAWPTIALDLNALNVNSNNILTFNNTLDLLADSIQNNDKNNSLINIANLYKLVSEYYNETSKDTEKNKIIEVKSNVISAYSLVSSEKWDFSKQFLGKAEEALLQIVNSSREYKRNRTK